MGASKCTQCCGVSEKSAAKQRIAALPPQWARGRSRSEQITGLSYTPPPAREEDEEARAFLGTRLPQRPGALALKHQRSPSLASGIDKCYGRPGEPVNKVFAQFSNDLEGFLPYSLVVSDETGLEFKAIGAHPGFQIDPLNVLKAGSLDYETLALDSLFVSLSKSISARPLPADEAAGGSRQEMRADERVRPPYDSLLQLHIRRTVLEGGQAIVCIAVQSERLALELIRSCEQLKRRRAIQYCCDSRDAGNLRPEDSPRMHVERSPGSRSSSRERSRCASLEQAGGVAGTTKVEAEPLRTLRPPYSTESASEPGDACPADG